MHMKLIEMKAQSVKGTRWTQNSRPFHVLALISIYMLAAQQSNSFLDIPDSLLDTFQLLSDSII